MKTHNLIQGEPLWHAHRSQYKNASDSPAVLGESKYKTRSQLLAERHSGITPEVDAATQRRFDEGHRTEALARPLAEKIIGEELSPVTGTEGEFGASFDGITFGGDIIWEHKTLNDDIRAGAIANNLPLMYRIQMEHQLMVSGAERCLFSATKWDGDMPVEEIHVWYAPDLELRARIVAAWKQFDADLAAYVPPEVIPAAVAAPIMALPALAIQIKGEVTLSNLPQFREAAETFIANIKTDLVTDEDFADAEATVKFCDAAEKNLEQAKSAAIAQTASIDELMRTIDHIKKQLSTKRLMLDKLVKSEKQSRKEAIVQKAILAFSAHVDALEEETKPARLCVICPDFGGAMKGLKKLSAMQEAVDTALRNGMFEADAVAKDIRAKLAWFKTATVSEYDFLFHDLQTIIHKPIDDLTLVVEKRIADHKAAEAAKLEAERARIQAEEQAKAEAKVRTEQEQIIRQREIEEEKDAELVAVSKAIDSAMELNQRAVIEQKYDAAVAYHSAVYKPPHRDELIAAIAFAYKVPDKIAADWLFKEFQQRAAC